MRRCATTGLGVALAVTAAACGDVDVPEPPSVAALVAAYEAPTASLDADLARTLRTAAVGRATELAALDAVAVVPALAASVGEDDAVPRGLVGNGFLELEVRCPGPERRFGELPPTDEGRFLATVTLTPRAIGSVVWGRFERCRYGVEVPWLDESGAATVSRVAVEVDAEANVFLGPNGLPFGRPPPDVLVEIEGDLALGDVRLDGVGFDFRRRQSGALETRIDAPGGAGHVFLVVDDGGRFLGVRTTEGGWACDFGGGVCVGLESGVVVRF